jgi:hypothetical protein
MTITINDDLMTLQIDGKVIATATQRPDGWWEVTNWPGFLNRNQAIIALTVTELLSAGYGPDDPPVTTLREELR